MDAVEQLMHLRETRAFITANPTMVTFKRPVAQVPDGAGGRDSGGAPTLISPQRVRIIPSRSRSTNLSFFTKERELFQSRDSVVMGEPTLDIQREDEFDWSGEAYKVLFVVPDRTYCTLAQIELLGANDRRTL